MLWRLWLSVLLCTANIAGWTESNRRVHAAEPPDYVAGDAGNSLMVRWNAVHFRLVLGRLELDPPRHRNGSKTEESSEPTPRRESFTVTSERGIPSLHYSCRTPSRETVLDVIDADQVQLLSDLPEADERLTLTQPSRGPLLIRLRSAGGEKTFTSPSWLHLQSTHPDLFARHLEDFLASLLPDLSIQQLGNDAAADMLRLASHTDPPNHMELFALVDQLNAGERRVRDRAQTQLLGYGIMIVPFLDDLPRRDLQQEQRARIDAIRRQLRPRQSDSPARVARWLVADPKYWNAIAADFSSEQRFVANRHLQRIQGEGLNPVLERPTRVAQSPESSNRK